MEQVAHIHGSDGASARPRAGQGLAIRLRGKSMRVDSLAQTIFRVIGGRSAPGVGLMVTNVKALGLFIVVFDRLTKQSAVI